MTSNECPSRDQLVAFAVGKLTDEDSSQIAAHLDSCAACQSTIQALDESHDTLASHLKHQVPAATFEDAEFGQIVKLVQAIGREPSVAIAARDLVDVLGTVRDYRLLEVLGSGGMGKVYKALHTQLDKVVALKVLPEDRMKDSGAVERFHREMKAVGKLNHPNIVSAHDAGESAGTHFLVMEMIDGIDLSRLVRKVGALSMTDACEIVRQAALGLQYVHENGLVHRDIKPSNLMLAATQARSASEGCPGIPGNPAVPLAGASGLCVTAIVKILDLGLARLYTEGESTNLTDRGQIMGTLDYMAPEQADDTHSVDIRADIYSLGCTLYKLLTGHAPFGDRGGDRPVKKMMAHATAPIPSIADKRPDVPAELAAVLAKMLAKDPADRYSTPAEVADAVGRFAVGSDLASLAARAIAPEQPKPAEALSRKTDEYLSSAMTGTKPSNSGGEAHEAAVEAAQAEPEQVAAQAASVEEMNVARPESSTGVAVAGSIPPRPSQTQGVPHRPSRGATRFIAAAAAVLLFSLGVAYAPQVIRIITNKGVIVVETDAADIEVTVKKDGVVITDPSNQRRFALTAGEGYELEIKELPDGLHVFSKQFALTRGGRQVVKVQWELASKPQPPKAELAVPVTDLDRRVAQCALALGGMVFVRTPAGRLWREPGDELPSESFHVIGIYVSSPEFTDESLRQLGTLEELEQLRLPNTSITDQGLSRLSRLRTLNVLDLNGTQVSGEGLREIASLPNLRNLTLNKCERITDDSVADIARLPNLVSLQFGATGITDQGLEQLATQGLKNIELLGLHGSRVTGRGLECLNSFPNLTILNVGDLQLSDEGLVHLPGLPKLTTLFLDKNPITDECLESLKTMPSLELLSLLRTNITAAGVAKLQASLPRCRIKWGDEHRMLAEWVLEHGGEVDLIRSDDGTRIRTSSRKDLPPSAFMIGNISFRGKHDFGDTQLQSMNLQSELGRLDLADTSVSSAGLRLLAGRQISHLNLSRTPVDDAGLRHLRNVQGLSGLHLTDTAVSDVGVSELAEIDGLLEVGLGNTKITDQALHSLRRLPSATSLILHGTGITDAGLADLAVHRKLKYLLIQWCKNISDAGIKLLAGLVDIETLELPDGLSNASIEHLCGLSRLTTLSIGGPEITDTGVKRLVELFPRLQSIGLHRVNVTDEGFRYLINLNRLTNVSISNARITDAALAELKQLPNIELLGLDGTGVSDAGLDHLVSLKKLTRLGLLSTKVTPAGVAKLQQALPNCKIDWDEPHRKLAEWVLSHGGRLRVAVRVEGGEPQVQVDRVENLPANFLRIDQIDFGGHAEITDSHFEEFGKLCRSVELAEVDLRRSSITSASLAHLKGLRISQLLLSATAVDDQAVPHFQTMNGLTSLGLHGTKITDGGVAGINQIESIEGLGLAGTAITDRSLELLKRLPTLKSLSLYKTHISDYGMEHLRGHRQLTTLQLQINQIGDAGMKHVGSIESLQSLDISSTRVTDVGVKELAPLKELTQLGLGNPGVTDESLRFIADSFPRLTTLGLPDCSVSDAGLEHMNKLVHLEHLDLRNPKISDAGLVHLKSLSRLTLLELPGTSITDAGLKQLQVLSRLSHLDVKHTAVTANGVAELQRALPNCSIITSLPATAMERIIDDGDAAYSELARQGSPGWQSGKVAPDQAYGGDYRYASDGAATARWTFDRLPVGQYEVFTTWTAGPTYADQAAYSIYVGDVMVKTVTVNQRQSPDDVQAAGRGWKRLGTFDARTGSLRVELDNRISKGGAQGGVVADAVRIVRVKEPTPTP